MVIMVTYDARVEGAGTQGRTDDGKCVLSGLTRDMSCRGIPGQTIRDAARIYGDDV